MMNEENRWTLIASLALTFVSFKFIIWGKTPQNRSHSLTQTHIKGIFYSNLTKFIGDSNPNSNFLHGGSQMYNLAIISVLTQLRV